MAPVPPPATDRVPETVGVNVRDPAKGTMVCPKVRPLKEAVDVAKVMLVPVVVAQPEPSSVMPDPPLPLTQVPLIAKQPLARLMPPELYREEVAEVKLAMPFTESWDPGLVVPMPR